MIKLSPGVIFLCLSVYSALSHSEPLRFSYWADATPPFVDIKDNKVQGGILKDLGESIGAELNLPVEFVNIPVPRIESQLQAGLIDVDCITSPIWKDTPEAYHWSPVLFEGSDRFLVKRELQHKIQSFTDLKGLTLGIYKGYIYHQDIMDMIARAEIKTIKVTGIEHGIKLLQLGRLDALVDFGILLEYQLKKLSLKGEYALADKYADKYDLSCAYSKKSRISSAAMNDVINKIINSGKLDQILSKYR